MEFKLYCFAQSGNAFKVALMLNLCGAKWEPRFVDFFGGETRTPQYREKSNEMGEVPVLEHRGKRLAQSGVILGYLADHFGKFQGENKLEVLRWLLWDNHKLTSNVATLRFLVQFQKTGETPVTEFLRGRIKGSLGILDKHLSNSAFAVGNEPSIADFSMCGYLYWPDEFGVSWTDYPRIGAWLERIRKLPGWVHPYELMPGHPLKRPKE
jgi:glutathione S-transferase